MLNYLKSLTSNIFKVTYVRVRDKNTGDLSDLQLNRILFTCAIFYKESETTIIALSRRFYCVNHCKLYNALQGVYRSFHSAHNTIWAMAVVQQQAGLLLGLIYLDQIQEEDLINLRRRQRRAARRRGTWVRQWMDVGRRFHFG